MIDLEHRLLRTSYTDDLPLIAHREFCGFPIVSPTAASHAEGFDSRQKTGTNA
jgi:hypothetical protein